MMHTLREGELVRLMKTKGVDRGEIAKEKSRAVKITSKGRINQIVWRRGEGWGSGGLEMFSGHGDGSLGVWRAVVGGEMSEDEDGEGGGHGGRGGHGSGKGKGKGKEEANTSRIWFQCC